MNMRRTATAAALAASALAPLLISGAGTAAAASDVYCYRNANNDNGTRVHLRSFAIGARNTDIIVVDATAYLERYAGDGVGYLITGSGVDIEGQPVRASAGDANAICAAVSQRAGFGTYGIGTFG
ncbi:hypothetical protein [Williamsia sp. CHRR-6]|uniref:hypothetical protein n=1 Tax=Williamsia sp. CHRR-6 TaxID=2835871 RepID=UPI001BD929F2|nr:hypothetical protein [Williamsia sp. CHRR-6]MBT0567713.1 hypothetical protein [Williamsia sp. CHRR-6]